MEIMQMNRGGGKTTYLIKKSAEFKYPIICCSETQRRIIKDTAKEMGLDIPDPISFSSINSKEKLRGLNCFDKLLIDDLEYVLKILFGKDIYAATVTCDSCESMNNYLR